MQPTTVGQPSDQTSADAEQPSSNRHFAAGLVRAFGGALIFAFPLLMTMEMWALGFSMSRMRLVLLLVVLLPVLGGLSIYGGFEENTHWWDALLDPFIAYAVGFCASTVLLAIFGVIKDDMAVREVLGKIGLHAIPASLGAMLALNQFGERDVEQQEHERGDSYFWDVFVHGVGALFLAFTAAPTEEMILISYQMRGWQSVALPILCLLIIHGFVYAADQRDQAAGQPKQPFWRLFLRFSIVGYALALLVSCYLLWTFGRTTGLSFEHLVRATIVLGFPASLGAGAVRLLL